MRFCSSLQAWWIECSWFATLWWAWSLLLIRVCSSWSWGSNQSWCFLSGLPRYVLAVLYYLYTTCCRAAHSSSGVELSFSSHWARALIIFRSKLSLWLMVLRFAVLSLVGLLVPCLLFFSYSESHFWPQHLVIGLAVCSMHGSSTVDVYIIPTPRDDEVDHMPVSGTRMHPSGLAFILLFVTISSNSEHRASRSSPLELHFPIPCLSMTKGHLSLSLPILALMSPISSSLSVRGMPLRTLASWL